MASNVLINNESELEFGDFYGSPYIGRYPGSLANGILISVCDAVSFDTWPFRARFEYRPTSADERCVAIIDTTGKIQGQGSIFQEFALNFEILNRPELPITVEVQIGGNAYEYDTNDPLEDIIDGIVDTLLGSPTNDSKWELIGTKVSRNTGVIQLRNKVLGTDTPDVITNPSLHVSTRMIRSGGYGDLLEKYELLSTTKGAKREDGATRWIVDVLNRQSKWIYIDPNIELVEPGDYYLDGGVDDYDTTLYQGLLPFKNSEKYTINYLFGAIRPLEKKLLHEIAETRRDCIAFVAPDIDDVVNNAGNEVDSLIDFRNVRFNIDSTYVFTVDNWARVYDPYNDTYRWIPTCGGTAGLKARTDNNQNAWTSPAGHTRGKYLGYDRLAWSAAKEERDELYKMGVNSVVDFGDEGMVLFGDKMTTSKPSAFSRINVRSAFIVAEVSVANFAKYYFFENNNADTQSQFLNAVNPFFRRMVTENAFERVETQVDMNNNTLAVRQANRFVGNFRIWPQYSINYIDLYFDAMGSDVSFEEIEN